MKKRLLHLSMKTLYSLAAAVMVFGLSLQAFAQTAANTDIKNVASATYSDGTNDYSTVSNEVTVTVAKVAGLTITPDDQDNPTVVAGQTGVQMTYRVTNVGNFTDDVKFLTGGASLHLTGPATITAATVDGTDIFANGTDITKTLAQNGFVDVVVTLSINSNATPGSTIQVFLGDAATGTNFDNVAADSSANEVSTVSTNAVNGSREARGDISVLVDNDALAKVTLSAPTGPVALGSDITYTAQACNDGLRTLNPVIPGPNAPDTQVYIYAPIPEGTVLTNVGSLPSGTQFSTDALTTAPLAATWDNSAPGTLSNVKRIRIPVGASIAPGTCATAVTFDVTVITDNANTAITEYVDVFGSNSIGSTITDRSGDSTPNSAGGPPVETTLEQTGGILNGPNGQPAAVGPTDNNDDYTNRSVNSGIAGVAPGGVTTASGTVTFTNTVQNTGNADDTYTLTAPTVPAGATVEISTDSGSTWTTVSGGGNKTIAVPFNSSANYLTRITLPAGITVLTAYDTVIRATSAIDPTKSNDTIDRLYTGFVQINKSFVIDNQTGVGGATDAVPGADIIYTITYSNVSSSGGSNNSTLTASNIVITEDGTVAPNNWASTTAQVVGSALDSTGGTITGDSAGSSVLTDTVATLAPGASGTFTFKRKIN